MAKKQAPKADPLQEEVTLFIEYVNAKRFSRNLRKLLLEYLQTEMGREAMFLDDLIYDLETLYRLLDVMEDSPRK